MAPLKSSSPGPTSFIGGGMNATFANSKFFLKKQNRAVTKIQAVVRAFLVQARVFRETKLEPRLKDLADCERRKLDELKTVEEQKKKETEELPAIIKKEAEEAEGIAEELQREIDDVKKDNAELKEKSKALKHSNKELEKEMSMKSKNDFKLEIQTTKLKTENDKLEKDLQWYKERIWDYECALENKQHEVQRVLVQKNIYRKFIRKVVKLMESNVAEEAPSSPSKKVDRRKHMIRRSSIQKLPGEEPSFDWATQSYDWASQSNDWSKQPITVDPKDDDEEKDKKEGLSKRRHSTHHHSHSHRSKKNGGVSRKLMEEIRNIKKELIKAA